MMIVSALLTVALATSDAEPPVTTGLDAFTRDASARLLEGRGLPADYRRQLLTMSPTDRLQAIIFLRRSGLLSGDIWLLEDVLRPSGISGPNEIAE
ncbi:hypothetical protein [Paracoccus onubensis]|nr:hypothetical protein [Paracoccus onubensis]